MDVGTRVGVQEAGGKVERDGEGGGDSDRLARTFVLFTPGRY